MAPNNLEVDATNETSGELSSSELNSDDTRLHLFISYSRTDKDIALRLVEALSREGMDCWIDQENIPPTVEWKEQIERGIEDADAFLFLISPDSVQSNPCREEIAHAVQNNKRLIPVVVRDTKTKNVPIELGSLNWIFVRGEPEFATGLQSLITAIQTDYAWVQFHRRLQVRALEWKRERYENSLLLRGKDLEDAESQLVTNSSKEPQPTQIQRTYVLSSRQASNRQRRITRAIAVVVIISLAVLAVTASIQAGLARSAEATAVTNASIAETQKANAVKESNARATAQSNAEANQQLAEERATISRARELAAQSAELRERNFAVSLLLGVEAFKTLQIRPTRGTLMDNAFAKPELQAYLGRYNGFVENVAFSPDGKILAATYDQGMVILWNTETRQPIGQALHGQKDFVNSVTFSPNGEMLATSSCGEKNSAKECIQGEIILWKVPNVRNTGVGTVQQIGLPLRGQAGTILSVAFSPDGDLLASGSADGTVMLWDVATMQPIRQRLGGEHGLINSVAFSHDAKTLAAGTGNNDIILWDVASALHPGVGQELSRERTLKGHTNSVFGIAFSPDGKTLASASWDKTIILWDVKSGQALGSPLIGHTDLVYSVSFSPDGKTLASGSFDSTILLWNVETGKPIAQPLRGHNGTITSVDFSPDGKTLASAGADGTLILWDLVNVPFISQLARGPDDYVYTIAFSPDGKTIATGSGDTTIILWDAKTTRPIGEPLKGHTNWVRVVAFSPDGKKLASGGDDGMIILWDVATHQAIGSPVKAESYFVHAIAFSPDGKMLATAGGDQMITLWDLKTMQSLGPPLTGHNDRIFSVAFSPDGKTLASGSADASVILWDVKTRKQIGLPLRWHSAAVNTIAFSPDGSMLASAGDDSIINLWDVKEDVKTGKPSNYYLAAHTDPVVSLAFSPDGQILASNSMDATIILWDLQTRQPIGQPLRSNRTYLYGIAFSPDGQSLASGTGDGAIILWDLNPTAWMEKTCQRVRRNFTLGEWVQYFPNEDYRATCPEWPLDPQTTSTP